MLATERIETAHIHCRFCDHLSPHRCVCDDGELAVTVGLFPGESLCRDLLDESLWETVREIDCPRSVDEETWTEILFATQAGHLRSLCVAFGVAC